MFWRITRDHLIRLHPEMDADAESRVGVGNGDKRAVPLITFKLYDDDGEHYYTGVCDKESLDAPEWEPGSLYEAYAWAANDAGATDLRVNGESIFG